MSRKSKTNNSSTKKSGNVKIVILIEKNKHNKVFNSRKDDDKNNGCSINNDNDDNIDNDDNDLKNQQNADWKRKKFDLIKKLVR